MLQNQLFQLLFFSLYLNQNINYNISIYIFQYIFISNYAIIFSVRFTLFQQETKQSPLYFKIKKEVELHYKCRKVSHQKNKIISTWRKILLKYTQVEDRSYQHKLINNQQNKRYNTSLINNWECNYASSTNCYVSYIQELLRVP
ncbi:transmembrane protein, putative (macronuclear) [Tetrahymena thermophila SB210]|uniref:Transmembrane protein, putative n=1 Tax=Tetrahymena thermophila (strain SB210) TaxID=312017 RepID=W7X2R4_TETTS|nr:transmembrane protein, putative [Tetrahymena thermophila SB210]EWS73580.1 transmembrane protein, putative [Tetrahymena thermophila SB210]|eukprot:XP_012653903.1 transmembrane protein, putative [Tetrahymena thermophila SB210]